jgi:catechol 2,3-dioxygenase-like lactoylglutathione lyase family enzyme
VRQQIGYVTLLVRDYEEAMAWYCEKLGFQVVEDTPLSDGKRWVLLAPQGSVETRLLLAKVSTEEQTAQIGNQAGGRVFLFLHTDDFWAALSAMREKGVDFLEEPRQESLARSLCSKISTEIIGICFSCVTRRPKPAGSASLRLSSNTRLPIPDAVTNRSEERRTSFQEGIYRAE